MERTVYSNKKRITPDGVTESDFSNINVLLHSRLCQREAPHLWQGCLRGQILSALFIRYDYRKKIVPIPAVMHILRLGDASILSRVMYAGQKGWEITTSHNSNPAEFGPEEKMQRRERTSIDEFSIECAALTIFVRSHDESVSTPGFSVQNKTVSTKQNPGTRSSRNFRSPNSPETQPRSSPGV